MQRLASASLAFSSVAFALAGCFIHAEETHDDPPTCTLVDQSDGIPPERRSPYDLMCKPFGAPCSDVDGDPTSAHVPPIPTWAECESECAELDEHTCAERSDCRVVRNAYCAFEGVCITDFVGCFPTDQQVDTSISCTGADAWECSRNPNCTAWHDPLDCPPNALVDQCPRQFIVCTPEGTIPGSCSGHIACDQAPPQCPAGTTPGISGGCYTRACIPLDRCSPSES